jgi:hypothetical protein
MVADEREEQVLLRVCGGMWTAEVPFNRSGVIYLASGWKRFYCVHQIRAMHFLVFNYDGQFTLNITVFDKTMCCRHYTLATLANATNNSSSYDK